MDLWSIGVVTFVLLTGKFPFDGDNEEQIFASIRGGACSFASAVFRVVSPNARDFIARLLVVNPAMRMTAEVAAAHPWLSADAETLSGNSLDASLPGLRQLKAKKTLGKLFLALAAMNKFKRLRKRKYSTTEEA